jgi:hypothetical protein
MNHQPLSRDLIPDTTRRRLSLLIDRSGMDVFIYSRAEDNSILWSRLDYDKANGDRLKALEELIYDNPLLLNDFQRVDVLIDTERFMMVPDEEGITPPQQIFDELYPDRDFDVEVETMNNAGTKLAMAVHRDFLRFVRRTFNNPHVYHRLSPMIRYFGYKNRLGNTSKFHVNLSANKVDIIGYKSNDLTVVNSIESHSAIDVLYYVQAIANQVKFDTENDQMYLSGDPTLREEVMPLLRRYISYVMPVIFPSDMFKAGKESMLAPFELIALALCE